MLRLMKSIAVGVVVSGALLACDTKESDAQVVVTSYYPPQPVVSYMRVRRGLFGLRRAYIPVVSCCWPNSFPIPRLKASVHVGKLASTTCDGKQWRV